MKSILIFLKDAFKGVGGKIKLIVICSIVLLIIGLFTGVGVLVSANKELKHNYELLSNNHAASIRELSSAKEEAYIYKLTLEDYYSLSDSSSNTIKELQSRLKIKDKHIKSLQNLMTTFNKSDTIILKDTIFKEPYFSFDTIIGDEWLNNHLCFEYPSNISINTNVESEKNVIIYYSKETINTPKKCWLSRLFQKKQKVIRVYVNEQNPYIIDQNNEFIEIIK